jgi:uncharacterized protein involved in type VI secretion and phage assembly
MADTKLIAIEVNLPGGDASRKRNEFELVMVDGVEGLSMPYKYDVKLFRKRAKTHVFPNEIINTVATIEINRKRERGFDPIRRTGIVEQFETIGAQTRNAEFRVYAARIVPPFKMLDREVTYRVFENQDVVTILETVLKDVPSLVTDMKALRSSDLKFPRMEYCVQFGESTFAFLSRLMARFGIHYFFASQGGKDTPQNDLMVFEGDNRRPNAFCQEFTVDLVPDKDFSGETNKISGYEEHFEPTFRSSIAGNFNVLAPTKPFRAREKIARIADVAKPTAGPARNFGRQEFPSPFDSTPDAFDYTRRHQRQEEATIETISGRSGNRTFIPGHQITIGKDLVHLAEDVDSPFSLSGKSFLLKWVGFAALEPSPAEGTSTGEDVGKFITDLFWNSKPAADVVGGIADGLLNDYLKDSMEFAFQKKTSRQPDHPPWFFPVVLASTGAGMAGAAIGNLVSAISGIATLPKATFNSTFVATASDVPVALPAATGRPTSHGPHLATVIGDDGTDTAKGEISADALGRVRVRFPWDLGGPIKVEEQPKDLFAVGTNTCWVRVAQGWAGRNFGVQFLPRIGHEVVVEFIDGDPERPIITGSLYNADRGLANLPFSAFPDGPKPFKAEDLLTHTGFDTFQRSGVKTAITPPSSSDERGFHMLRFDDTRGKEQLLVRSQGRYDLTALHSHFDTTHGDRHILVRAGTDDKGKTFGGSNFNTVGGEFDLHVGKDRYEGVGGVEQVAVKGDTTFDLQAGFATIVGKTASLNATKIILEAQTKITLKVGGSFIVVDPCGVFISGPMVQINSGGSPDSTTDADMTDPADAAQADPGEPPNFLALQPKGGGGGRRHRKVKAQHGFVCSLNADGTIQVTKAIKVDMKDPNYAAAVIADLSIMNNTKTGKALLDDLDGTGKSVLVRPLVPAPNPPNAFATATDGTAAANGTGSDSTVDYNPGDWPSPLARTKPPGDVILFHELTHADHNAKGTNDTATKRTDNFTDNEEFNTIGPENQYRDERGHPRRNDHTDL